MTDPVLKSVVVTLSHVMEINDVTEIVVTEAVDDGEGGFIRSIRIFGQPNGDSGLAIVEVKVRAPTRDAIYVHTPEMTF